ncbi:MAG: hypothetical protein AAFZ15_14155 [Bacteroidota bacterium]
MKQLISQLEWIEFIDGPMWVVLTIFIVSMIYKIIRDKSEFHPIVKWLGWLLVLILLHPLYSYLFPGLTAHQIGHLIILVFTFEVFRKVYRIFPKISFYLLPQLFWIGITCGFTFLKMAAAHNLDTNTILTSVPFF